jgi:ADP-dependent phosphofructokinase/glucokinase
MLIAQQKKQENIAEYILYMYQIEDIVRAYNFDLDAIIENYVKPQLPDESFLVQYTSWYNGIISEMKSNGLEKTGHLPSLNEVIVELSYLHNTLINLTNDPKYKDIIERATPFIEEFKEKSDLKNKNHLEIALHAMYMKLLLRLQKKEISAETEEAFDAMRMVLAYVSRAYHKMKSGDLDFLQN